MSKFFQMICLLLTGSATLARPGLYDWGWSADLASTAWQAEPSWQSDPAANAESREENGQLYFVVPDAGRGMKWSQRFQPVSFEESPYLVLTYLAEGLLAETGDYFIYVDDLDPSVETRPVRLNQVVADGQRHRVAVDLRQVAEGDRIRQVAVQVRAGEGPATVSITELSLLDSVPADAVLLDEGGGVAPRPEWWAPLETAAWEARPSWLSNAGRAVSVMHDGHGTRFEVGSAGTGMKWSWFLDEPVALQGHAFVVMRYRGDGTAARSDYALCVLGEATAEGKDYAVAIPAGRLRHDGRWHTVSVSLGQIAADFPQINGLAIQAQAAEPKASLSISKIGFTSEIPPIPWEDYLAGEPGETSAGCREIELSDGNVRLRDVLRAADVTGWPGGATLSIDGIGFVIPPADARIPATGLRQRGTLSVDVQARASQVFLLTLAVFKGAEEEVYSRDGKLTSIPDIDRFSGSVTYADGTSEACFPYNVTAEAFQVDAGAQVLCLFTDPAKTILRIDLTDNTAGGGFAVPAVTVCEGDRRIADPDEALPHLHGLSRERYALSQERALALLRVADVSALRDAWQVSVAGAVLPSTGFQLQGRTADEVHFTCHQPPVDLTVIFRQVDGEIECSARVRNRDRQPRHLGVSGPHVGPFLLGAGAPENQWYLFPSVGTHFSNRPFTQRSRYGGRFPLQFMVTFNPTSDDAIYLRTLHTTPDCRRDMCIQKDEQGVSLWLEYPERIVDPGEDFRTATTRIGRTGGDWRAAFDVYREWLASWYAPRSPRQDWFRAVFNFRQRFLHAHEPLYDSRTGTYHLEDTIAEAAEHFGGMEYLHIFDWGNVRGYGRLYGRTGDLSPFDGTLQGGIEAFQRAIDGIQQQGVRVGLYIEGYLLQQKGKLGQAHGNDWQIIQRNGQPLFWPGSTEMMICSHVPAWREVQASTYAARVRELGVDGMYLDQFGFANVGKDCWSSDHGHPLPGYAVTGEHGLARQVRDSISAVKQGVVLYGEEAPCDVNSQLQDGSFSYHMKHCRSSAPLAPWHPLRFAVPSFKTFEILVCDRPMGSWAEGVKWTFFNGEGIWLEGPATTWFRPRTLATIRRCHAILRRHSAAFASDHPDPLCPTLTPGVLANVFSASAETVMTLYNARHRTVSAVVPLPVAAEGMTWRVTDEWHQVPKQIRWQRGTAVVDVTLAPRGVGCLHLEAVAER